MGIYGLLENDCLALLLVLPAKVYSWAPFKKRKEEERETLLPSSALFSDYEL